MIKSTIDVECTKCGHVGKLFLKDHQDREIEKIVMDHAKTIWAAMFVPRIITTWIGFTLFGFLLGRFF